MSIAPIDMTMDRSGCLLRRVDYVVGRKQERDSFRGPRIAWERVDIAFRRQPRRRRWRVSFGTTAKVPKQL